MLSAPVRSSPPALHWGWLLFLSFLTSGMFLSAWTLVQAHFVKEIDPSSRAFALHIANFILAPFAVIFIVIAGLAAKAQGGIALFVFFAALLLYVILALTLTYAATFGMRRSLLRYYNTIEPYGLRLGPIMTFFFSVFYFQYHFNRIARWQQASVFAPVPDSIQSPSSCTSPSDPSTWPSSPST